MYKIILTFWFDEHGPQDWFAKSDTFDSLIQRRFTDLHRQAVLGELASWRNKPEGALAEIILLDQFSRNMFRGSAQAFATDPHALALAQFAIEKAQDKKLDPQKRKFLYMPFMHSESKVIHEQALDLFGSLDDPQTLNYERQHKVIIDRFGRYPHRNEILGRKNTPEELAFLKTEGSSF